MYRKISIDDLRIGMVIEKMDRAWVEHPFLTSRKKITSERHIALLREHGILEVTINTDEGEDLPPSPPEPAALPPAPPDPPPPAPPGRPRSDLPEPLERPVPFREEVHVARVVQREAQTVVQGVMQDVRLGKNIESGKVTKVVNDMIDSIFRNPDALSSLTRVKGYDEYTFVHSINVCVLSLTLGRHLAFPREDLRTLGIGALLHDAGKIRVPSAILNKAGKLTDDEFAVMKMHTVYSAEVLEAAEGVPAEAREVALQHHERFNGKGYPYGLQGDAIGRFGMVAAIVDVYDAMTSDRVYARGMPSFESIKKIYEWGGMHFRPEYVEHFIRCMGIYPLGTVVLLDTEEVAVVTTINHAKLLRPEVEIIFRNSRTRLPRPVHVDLMETGPDGKRYRRSIVRPLEGRKLNIDPQQFLSLPEVVPG